MASTSNTSSVVGADDNPIVLPDSPPIDRRSINFLLNRQSSADHSRASASHARPLSRSERIRQRRAIPSPVTAHQPSNIIDLTEEPDSPTEQRTTESASHRPPEWHGRSTSQAPTNGGRNPRRTNSTRISPPMLTRSDSTLMGGRHSIIDLTQDLPEENRPLQLPNYDSVTGPLPRPAPSNTHAQRRRTHGVHHHHHNHTHNQRLRHVPNDEIVEVVTLGAVGQVSDLWHNSLRHYHGFITGGLPALARAFNPPQLDVTRNAFAPPEEPPQPPMEAVPPARPGFSRDTHASSEADDFDTVAICPACLEELAYDPTDIAAPKNGNPSAGGGSRKRKRAPGEHHFWALKKCGHVYCADCFENRKPSKNNEGANFDFPKGRTGAAAHDVRCAVDGCDTKVGPKAEWVGIFL